MADKSNQLILEALSRAAAGEAPLHGGKSAPGLFPANAAGKQAASRCREDGLLARAPTVAADTSAKRPKTRAAETWTLSEKGFAFLLGQVSPRQVLNDLVRALENREGQLDELLTVAHTTRDQLTSLRGLTETVLRQVAPLEAVDGATGGLNVLFQAFLQRRPTEATPPQEKATNGATLGPKTVPACEAWAAAIEKHLAHWHSHGSGAMEDCPLAELYRQTCRDCAGLTIGQFHDSLRQLRDSGRVYLHPWTGPLYDLPEPPYALLVGHEVAYYASLRA